MLSRVADAVFWMARYMERANGLLRLIRTNYIASQDEVRDFSWQPILQFYGGLEAADIERIKYQPAQALEHLILDRENPASVITNVTRARENARSVQDHITKEVWQCLNDFHHLTRDKQLEEMLRAGDPVSAMDLLNRQGMMYYGVVDTTMSRGEDFSFLNTGKYIERGALSADILRIKIDEIDFDEVNQDAPGWRYLLYSLAGYELYLKNNRGNIQTDLVLQQVLYNMQFPHAVLYCLHQTNRYAERLRPFSQEDAYRKVEFQIGKLMNEVKYSAINLHSREEVLLHLADIKKNFYQIAQTFNQVYFGHS